MRGEEGREAPGHLELIQEVGRLEDANLQLLDALALRRQPWSSGLLAPATGQSLRRGLRARDARGLAIRTFSQVFIVVLDWTLMCL